MSHDPRDTIWDKSFETYYEAYFFETLADRLIDRWKLTDEVTKVVVALTAAGSAVSGWALWQDPNLKLVWALLAGTATVISIVHAALGVPGKLKDWEDFKRAFVTLRVKLETYRHRMEIDPAFSVKDFTDEYAEMRKEFGELVPRQKNDVFADQGPASGNPAGYQPKTGSWLVMRNKIEKKDLPLPIPRPPPRPKN